MPKVIDLPTATSMDEADYFLMEESGGGTKKITRSNSVDKITTVSNPVTQTSGGTVSGATLRICGRIAFLGFTVTAASNVPAGGNLFVGEIASAYKPVMTCRNASYVGGVCVVTAIASDGTITCRNVTSQISSGTSVGVTVVYLF